MKNTTRKIVAAKLALLMAVSSFPGVIAPAHAGIPVIDAGNLTQNIITAIEDVAQTLKQIEEYQTQLQQYENQLRNTLQPSIALWDSAQNTMNNLRGAIDTLNYYKNTLGSVDAYLGRFKDIAAYRNSPCYSTSGCTPAQWEAMKSTELFGSEAQKKANDALFKGLEKQQNNMVSDASRLQQLQSAAQGAQGQMQAIGYANQLASHQANQLLQIRALLVAQQNAITVRNNALQDREAMERASSEFLRRGTPPAGTPRTW